jgi:hypothetical protein
MPERQLNALGSRVRDSLLARHPEWSDYVTVLPSGDLETGVPAPRGSRAGHLVIFTARGEDTWIRYSPARACYCVGSDREMHAVLEALLRDDAFFVVVTNGDEWIETTLLRPGEEPVLKDGYVANVVSWSGRHDRIVTFTEKQPSMAAEQTNGADGGTSLDKVDTPLDSERKLPAR